MTPPSLAVTFKTQGQNRMRTSDQRRIPARPISIVAQKREQARNWTEPSVLDLPHSIVRWNGKDDTQAPIWATKNASIMEIMAQSRGSIVRKLSNLN